MVVLNNSTFGNSKNYFTYNTPNIKDFWQLKKLLNTLLYNTPNIKVFIFYFTISFKYSFVILPLCLFLSLPSPPPLSLSLFFEAKATNKPTHHSSQPSKPHLSILNPTIPYPLLATSIKRKKKKTPATLPKIVVFKFGPFNEL